MAGAGPLRGAVLGWRPEAPPRTDVFQAAVSGDQEWLRLSLKRVSSATDTNTQGLTVLHVAAQHGQLSCIKLLVESYSVDVNASCPRGRRPLHMALCPQSRPHSYACLTYLLEQGAEPSVSTEDGLTPLHMAAAAGLRECVEILVKIGADTHAQDSRGHTPFVLACILGHRVIARFLKNAMWQKEKKKDTERRKALQKLRQNLIWMQRKAEDEAKEAKRSLNAQKLCEWSNIKGLPLLWPPLRVSQTLSHAPRLSAQLSQTKSMKKNHWDAPQEPWNISSNPSKPPLAGISRPQGLRVGVHPEQMTPEPDLRQSVMLGRYADGCLYYTASWEGLPRGLPPLPLDVIQRTLFTSAFPSRMASPPCFQGSSVLDLPHLGCTPGPGTSPWTEVAMHLAETLEPGHY